MSRFIVIGAGVFGASTALHLAAETHNAEIFLFGLPTDSAQPASIDINKVVRTEYSSDLYRSLADEATRAWQHVDFKKFYHKCGWVVVHNGQDSSLPRPSLESTRMTEEQLRRRFNSIFERCELKGGEDITCDDSVAWVEASEALEKTIRLACEAGVVYREEEITGLCFEGTKFVGVLSKSGEQLRGFSVLLAMGPWTGPFIARHSQLKAPIGLLTNPCVSTAAITLDEEEAHEYRRMPILVRPTQGEIMPMDRIRHIKVTNAKSFTNDAVTREGPIEGASLNSHLFDENRALLAQFLPQFKDRKFSKTWYCYDCITPYQDFLICPVPQTQELYVAAGGSYHAFKFLPIIGDYVVQMIRGTLNPELERRWGWDRSGREGDINIHEDLIPRRVIEFKTCA